MSSPGTTTHIDFVEQYVAAAERFAVAVAGIDPAAPVPRCPGWTAYDLVCHLGNVHAWAATIVETGRRAVEQNDEPPSRKPRAMSEWYAGKAEDLYEVLRAGDAGKACWNFAFDDGRATFWQRRQLHETTIHTVDLFAAGGLPGLEIEPDIAADGVDEVLTVFLHRMHHRGLPAVLTAPLCLAATDTDRVWTVTPRAVVTDRTAGVPAQPRGSTSEAAPALIDGPPRVVDRKHPGADKIEAPVDVLYQVLWGRRPVAQLTLTGDTERIEAFLASPLVP